MYNENFHIQVGFRVLKIIVKLINAAEVAVEQVLVLNSLFSCVLEL
jgi:hypothetical protein